MDCLGVINEWFFHLTEFSESWTGCGRCFWFSESRITSKKTVSMCFLLIFRNPKCSDPRVQLRAPPVDLGCRRPRGPSIPGGPDVEGLTSFWPIAAIAIWGWVKTLVPSEPQNSWDLWMFIPLKCIYRYWPIAIWCVQVTQSHCGFLQFQFQIGTSCAFCSSWFCAIDLDTSRHPSIEKLSLRFPRIIIGIPNTRPGKLAT